MIGNKANTCEAKRAQTSFKNTMKNHKSKLTLQEIGTVGTTSIGQP